MAKAVGIDLGTTNSVVATLEGGRLERRRAEGKLKNLEARLQRAGT
jgi:glucosamine--fructose-6-phosphate aminotransferase (isomerizing)